MTDKPKVYIWCNAGAGSGLELWYAMAEDGEVMAEHCSSNEWFGRRDVHDQWPDRLQKYVDKFGSRDGYEVVYEVPPKDVVARNRARCVADEPVT